MIYGGKRRIGFTMVEMLTVMAGLTVAMALGGAILTGILRIQKASQMSLERTSARSVLADQFRADVAGSRGLLRDLGDARASETCLILQGNSGYIVYRLQDGRIERQERSGQGTILHRAMLGPQAECVRFAQDDRSQRLIAMSLEQSADKPQVRRSWKFKAALGGDWR